MRVKLLETESADIDELVNLYVQDIRVLIGTAMDPFRWRRNRSTPFAP